MKYKFKIAFLFIFSGIASTLSGASIQFEYDAAGNRTVRKEITLLKSAVVKEDIEDEEEIEAGDEPLVFTETLAQSTIYIYPNPTKGLLKVEINSNGENKPVSLQVYDISGKILLQQSNVASFAALDLSNQPAGVYILRLISDTEKSEWKIIKE